MEGIIAPIFHLVEEALIGVVQHGRLDTLLTPRTDRLAESEQSMETLNEQMVGCDALSRLVAQFLKP